PSSRKTPLLIDVGSPSVEKYGRHDDSESVRSDCAPLSGQKPRGQSRSLCCRACIVSPLLMTKTASSTQEWPPPTGIRLESIMLQQWGFRRSSDQTGPGNADLAESFAVRTVE